MNFNGRGILCVLSIYAFCAYLSLICDASNLPFIERLDTVSEAIREQYVAHHPIGHIMFDVRPALREFEPHLYQESPLSFFPQIIEDGFDFGQGQTAHSSHHSSTDRLSIFDDESIYWLPFTPQTSIWNVLFNPFGTIEMTIMASQPFDAITTMQLINGYSWNTEVVPSSQVSAEFQILMTQVASTLKSHNLKVKSPQQDQDSTPPLQNVIDDSRTKALRQYRQEKRQLLGNPETPHHATVSIPLYSYFWPFSRGWVGVRVCPIPQGAIASLSRAVLGSKQNETIPITISYQQISIVLSSLITVIITSCLFMAIPSLVQSHFIHISLGAGLGSLAFLAVAIYIIYRLTPFRKLTIPLGMTVGFFANAHHFLFLIMKRLFYQHMLLMSIITCIGALVGIIITIWFWKFDKNYTQPTSWFIRLILLFVIAVCFQSFIPMVLYIFFLILFSLKSSSTTVKPSPLVNDATLASSHSIITPHTVPPQQPQQHRPGNQPSLMNPRALSLSGNQPINYVSSGSGITRQPGHISSHNIPDSIRRTTTSLPAASSLSFRSAAVPSTHHRHTMTNASHINAFDEEEDEDSETDLAEQQQPQPEELSFLGRRRLSRGGTTPQTNTGRPSLQRSSSRTRKL